MAGDSHCRCMYVAALFFQSLKLFDIRKMEVFETYTHSSEVTCTCFALALVPAQLDAVTPKQLNTSHVARGVLTQLWHGIPIVRRCLLLAATMGRCAPLWLGMCLLLTRTCHAFTLPHTQPMHPLLHTQRGSHGTRCGG